MKKITTVFAIICFFGIQKAAANDSYYSCYVRVVTLIEKGKCRGAISLADSCIRSGCHQPQFSNVMGIATRRLTYSNDDTNNIKAVRFFSNAIAGDSSKSAYYNNRGWAYQELRKYDLAMADYKSIVA